jgi:hypothetical protein
MKLLALSSAISFVLFWFHLPAALLLGPMIAGISLSLRGAEIRVPRPFFIAAQAIIGCMIARSLTPSIFGVLLANWALVLLILFSTLAISALAGWLLVRYSDCPAPPGRGEFAGRRLGDGDYGPGVRRRCPAGGADAVSAGAVCCRRRGAGGSRRARR